MTFSEVAAVMFTVFLAATVVIRKLFPLSIPDAEAVDDSAGLEFEMSAVDEQRLAA